MKKIVALALAMIIMLASMTWMSVRADSVPFKDVASGKWYTDAVQYCYSKGYVGGYEDQTFRPNNKLTRAEMAVIMNKKLGLKSADSNTFKDVAKGKWYTEPILHCVKAGVMTGYSATQFGTNDTLTREQGAVILAKAFDVAKASGRTSFADDASISKWAVESVKAMAAKGMISGVGDNKFAPKTPLTRAQMCQIIYAAEVKNAGGDDPEKSSEEDTPTPSEKPVTPSEKPATPSEAPTTPTEKPAAPSEKPVTPSSHQESIRTGDVTDRTTTDSWEDAYIKYLDGKVKETTSGTLIDVDGDSEDELVVHADIGAGNLEILTYHNGKISTLPLNGAGIAYVPGKNQVMVAEYESGTYYITIWAIKNGTWTKIVGGSYQDPKDGPAVDEEGNDVFENYQWNGKAVSEEEFYEELTEVVDVENMEEVEE